jgi:hypothetical protein
MKWNPAYLRLLMIFACCGLLTIAFFRTREAQAGQAAVSMSRPGQEDLSFWVNHNGLIHYDVEGQVGFGDIARILLRRRANTESIRKLRDRFTFPIQDVGSLETPDLFRAEFSNGKLSWRSVPEQRFVAGSSRTSNIAVVIANRDRTDISVTAAYKGPTMDSVARDITVPAASSVVVVLRAVESSIGLVDGKLTLHQGSAELSTGVRFEVRPLVPLRVRILDETGRPTTARVYLTGSDGLAYAPHGSSNRIVAMSAEHYFHAEEQFEIDLPAGETYIEATRGQEYRLSSAKVNLEAGKPAEITVRLERWTHMARQGFWSADAHIHANYTSPHHQVISPRDVRLQAAGEDLNYANMMVANSGGAFIHDRQYFEGKPHRLTTPENFIYWNEENRSSAYGHMCFLGLTKLVEPFYNGFKDTPHWDDYPANYTLAQQVFDQGGAVSYAHPGMVASFDRASIKELPVDLALGQQTAMDVLSNNDETATTEMWYRLLNCGFRVAISAGTDSFTNVVDHYTAGAGRVYVDIGPRFIYSEWLKAFREGRSFASNGPVISLKVNDQSPGGEIRLDRPAEVAVRATVKTQTPVSSVELIVNGRSVHSEATAGKNEFEIRTKVRIEESSWIAVRVLGPPHRLILNDTGVFAHTSPVYATVGGRPVRVAADVKFYREWVQSLIARTESRNRFKTPEQKEEVLTLFRKALAFYQAAEGAQR